MGCGEGERERVREWEEAREGVREGVNVGRESDETERGSEKGWMRRKTE